MHAMLLSVPLKQKVTMTPARQEATKYSPSPLIRNHRFGVRGSDFLPKNKKFQKFSPYFLFLKISPRNAHKEIMKELYFFSPRCARQGLEFLKPNGSRNWTSEAKFLIKRFLIKGLGLYLMGEPSRVQVAVHHVAIQSCWRFWSGVAYCPKGQRETGSWQVNSKSMCPKCSI